MLDFAAIDFETANAERTGICSVGIIVVRGGEIVHRYYSLIRPEPDYYNHHSTRVHGLTAADTESARIFPDVWAEVEPLIARLPLVAHNKPFDEGCLKAVFRMYQMDYPDYPFFCTLQAARRQLQHLSDHRLPTVARCCGYTLAHHHQALADAEACAAIALKLL